VRTEVQTDSVRVGEFEELAEHISGVDTRRAACGECDVLRRAGHLHRAVTKACEFKAASMGEAVWLIKCTARPPRPSLMMSAAVGRKTCARPCQALLGVPRASNTAGFAPRRRSCNCQTIPPANDERLRAAGQAWPLTGRRHCHSIERQAKRRVRDRNCSA
jgi:hypothetical protein